MYIIHIKFLETNNVLRNQSYGILPSIKPTATAANRYNQPDDEFISSRLTPNFKQSTHKEIF